MQNAKKKILKCIKCHNIVFTIERRYIEVWASTLKLGFNCITPGFLKKIYFFGANMTRKFAEQNTHIQYVQIVFFFSMFLIQCFFLQN